MEKHIAIIPARAGSKSIINKNLVKLDGKKRIVDLAIQSAMDHRFFNKIILTTDIDVLVDDYKNLITVRKRPDRYCLDDSLMLDTVMDSLEEYEIHEGTWIWLLQPTSPFRESRHFLEIKKIIDNERYNSIISVKNVGPYHPNRTYSIKNNILYRLKHTNFENKQTLKDLYIRNGCFYVARCGDLVSSKSFYTGKCHGYEMDEKSSINIDGPMDLALAKIVANKRYKF